jgi:hypothetical protein
MGVPYIQIAVVEGNSILADHIAEVFDAQGIKGKINYHERTSSCEISSPAVQIEAAKTVLDRDAEIHGYKINYLIDFIEE